MTHALPQSLSVGILGELRVTDRGVPFALTALPKTIPLLGYLLMRRGEPLSRDRVASALWPDRKDAAARANLRRHAHNLAAALPASRAQWLITTPRTIELDAGADIWFDVAEYDRLAAEPSTLERAVALYRGELLAGFDDEWIRAERQRFSERHVANLETLLADARRSREHACAIAYAKEVLRIDPFREATLREMLAARFEAGDVAGALAAYERFSEMLDAELGSEPMPETQALVARMTRGEGLDLAMEPRARLATASERAVVIERDGLAFAGRDAELACLRRQCLPQARSEGSSAFVGGEAGIGKSRLVAEFALEVERGGGMAFAGTTSPIEAQPYEAVLEALRGALPLIALFDFDTVRFGVLGLVLPELANVRAGIAPPPPLDEEPERRRLFDTIAATFEALARRRPCFVIFEDLQWAGPATLALVEFLMRRAPALSLAFAATVRSGEPHDASLGMRRALQRANLAIAIELAPLGREAIRDVLVRSGRCVDGGEAAVDALHGESEGNPFFLGVALAGGSIAQRLRGIGDDARAFAQSAAVVGHAFDVEVVADVTGWPLPRATDALDELLDRRVVRQAARVAHAAFAFSHHLISRHLYDELEPRARAHAHRRAARALVRLFPAQQDALALAIGTHFERADLPGEASIAFLRAAERARTLGASEDALAAAERSASLANETAPRFRALALAEELHAQLADRDAQRLTLEALRNAARELGAADAKADVARRAALLANATARPEDEAAAILELETAARGLGRHWQGEAALARMRRAVASGLFADASIEAERAIAAFEGGDDAEGLLGALTAAAEVRQLSGDAPAARNALDRALALAKRFAGPRALGRVLRTISFVGFLARDFERAERACEEILELCVRTGDREGEAEIASRYASIRVRRFDLAGARAHFARARTIYERLGNRRALAALDLNANFATFAAGDVASAFDGFLSAGRQFAALGDLRGQGLAACNAGHCLTALGRTAEAIPMLHDARELAARSAAVAIEAQALANLGTALRRDGDSGAALTVLLEAIELRSRTESEVDLCEDLLELAMAYLDLARPRDAAAALGRCQAAFGTIDETSMSAAELWYGASLVHSACGEAELAASALARARRILDARAERFEAPMERSRFMAFGKHPQILAQTAVDVFRTDGFLQSNHER